MSVLIIGSCVVDAIIDLPHMPASGQDVYGSLPIYRVGGCAYNMACAMQQAGLQPDLLVNVGQGSNARLIEAALNRHQFQGWVRDLSGDNGTCFCFVEPGGQRTIVSCQGVDKKVDPAWFVHLGHYDWILFDGFQLTGPDAEHLVAYLESCQSQLFFCPGPVVHLIKQDHWQRLLALNPLIHLNEDEYAFTGSLDRVVITQGAKGCTYIDHGRKIQVAAYPVSAIDTIGAGDTHAASLLARRIQGDDWPEALRLANLASSQIVQIRGAVKEDE